MEAKPSTTKKKKELSLPGLLQSFVLLIGISMFALYFLNAFNSFTEQADRESTQLMKQIENDVAVDSVRQYEIAKRSGSAIDRCVHAGFVAAAYLQAKDEPNYRKWKKIEEADCERAGLTR